MKPNTTNHDVVPINDERDIVTARKVVRDLCKEIKLGLTDTTRMVTAASELARNIYRYAKSGTMAWKILTKDRKRGVQLIFLDNGPGIEDIEQAMQEGFTTSRSLGMGLPGTKRLVDEMQVESKVGAGTRIMIQKWTR